MDILDIERKTQAAVVLHQAAISRLEAERDGLTAASQQVLAVEQSRTIAVAVGRGLQEEVRVSLSSLVTEMLRAVWPEEDIEFAITFVDRRGKTEADLQFLHNGNVVEPLEGQAGGMLDVAAFALRMSVILRQQPPVRRLLILDEPFRFVSADRLPRVRQVMERLSEELGVQIIQITHSPALKAGNIIEVG
jgi:DNA repair ATPase RecN